MDGYNFPNAVNVIVTGNTYHNWRGIMLSVSNDPSGTKLYVAIANPSDKTQAVQTWLDRTECTVY